jgi:hypothetical protein
MPIDSKHKNLTTQVKDDNPIGSEWLTHYFVPTGCPGCVVNSLVPTPLQLFNKFRERDVPGSVSFRQLFGLTQLKNPHGCLSMSSIITLSEWEWPWGGDCILGNFSPQV